MGIIQLGSLETNGGLTKKSGIHQLTGGHLRELVQVETVTNLSEISLDSSLGRLIMSVDHSVQVRVQLIFVVLIVLLLLGTGLGVAWVDSALQWALVSSGLLSASHINGLQFYPNKN